ncbi:MAG: hypothetical protein AAB221_05410 [Bacteroidota bacterium]
MNITITSVDRDEYILITSIGVLENRDDLLTHAELIYQEISKYDKHKILIDDIETRFPPNRLYYYDQVHFFGTGFPREIRFLKIAIVLSPEFEEIGKFWETLAVNRGFEYHSFISMAKAHQWLIQ